MVNIDMLPDLITLEEAAEYLGVNTETARLYARRKQNPLPVVMISAKIIRINKQHFLDWLENTRNEKIQTD